MKLISFVILCAVFGASSAGTYQYKIEYFDTLVDHFTFVDNATFKLRYLVNDSYIKDERSPILFYTGNEGDIELFAENSGFIWKAGINLNAMVVFAEHRFYGKTLPFGNQSYNQTKYLGYLTSSQALADYADLLEYINPNRTRPVIAFGGSYGGMLASWFRMKYPNLVAGALASSAPVRQFSSITSCEIFNQILTSVYRVAIENSSCVQNIQNLWPVLQNYTSNDTGRKFLNQNFKFCTPMNKSEDFSTFYDYLQDVFGNLAMANYPYETSFLAKLPAFPVRQFCGQIDKLFDKHEELLVAFNNALQVYTNYTGDRKCLDISTAYDPSMGDEGWNFQACTEMVMPMCSNGKDDMFMEKKWNFKEFSDDCYKKFKVYPRERNAITEYVALNVDSTPNVIFSNGLLDPWSGGGVLKSKNDQTIVVILPEGAHHLDLRADNRADPASVRETRNFYINTFRKWIDAYYDNANKA